jgi:hypothetical protein
LAPKWVLPRFLVNRASGSRGLIPSPPNLGTLDRRRHQGRVDQRAAVDHKASRIELPVGLGQRRLRQAERLDRLPETPDRAMIRRLAVEGRTAKAPERQPVAHRFLRRRIGEIAPLL